MGRLIDSDTFILALMDASLSSVDEDTILDLIDSIPTADAVPVRRGHWIDKGVRDWHCSECNYQMAKIRTFDGYCYDDKPNFCPNCGADMRELPEPPKEVACD